MSLYQLLPPITAFVLFATIATALFLQRASMGESLRNDRAFDIARTRAVAGLRAQVFNDDFPGLVIYTEGIERRRSPPARAHLRRARRSNTTRSAREGLMISDSHAQTVTLRLLDGWMHTNDPTGKAEYHTEFQSYDVNSTCVWPTPDSVVSRTPRR
jgi:lipopolysaccharide export system permease protein